MKRTKFVLAAAVLAVSGLALPGSASAAAVHGTPTVAIHGVQPMSHPMGAACGDMLNEA